MRLSGHVAHMEERIDAYWVLVEKPEGRILLGRPRHRWKDFKRWDGGAWTGLMWLRIGTGCGHL